MLIRQATVTITDENGAVVWAFGGLDNGGITSMAYLEDGTQERIIDVLLGAVVQARGQLRRPIEVLTVVPITV